MQPAGQRPPRQSAIAPFLVAKDPRSRLARLAPLAQSYKKALRAPEFLFALGTGLVVCGAAALLARSGLPRDRLIARGMLGLLLAAFFALMLASRRRLSRPERILRRTVGLVDRARADELARADALFEASLSGQPVGSAELVRLHWEKLVASLDTEAIRRALQKRGRIFLALGLVLCFGTLSLASGRIFELVEGTNLLLVQDRVAPYMLPYVEKARVIVRPPSDMAGRAVTQSLWGDTAVLPVGSRVTVEAEAIALGRDLVLTDGEQEIPFRPDAEGTLTAEITIEETIVLRIAARFGTSLIIDPFEKTIFALPDREPTVILKGAPRSIALRDVTSLPLEYEVTDDRGITEVDLVLESGRREERTALARPARGTLGESGVTELKADHPMLLGAYLPVEVRIEARDAALSRRGAASRSESITIVPEALGASLVERYRLFKKFRSSVVHYYANARAAGFEIGGARREAQGAASGDLNAALEELEKGLATLPEGATGSLGFLRAQVSALEAKGPERLDPESAVLAVDVLLSELSAKDAERLASDLALALDEVKALAQKSSDTEKNRGPEVIAELRELLAAGAKNLSELGVLGADLGSVAEADLGRLKRSVKDRAWDRVARIAEHLAARLRRGSPSFGARGEAPATGPASVESGTPKGGGQGSLSQAPEEFRSLEKETERLRKEHAGELSELERIVRDARLAAQADAPGREEELAEKLRDAVAELPEGASAPGSARAEAALGRGQAEAMADALEGLDIKRAIERGEAALGALERARELGEERGSTVSPEALERAVTGVQAALDAARANQARRREALKGDDSLRGNAERERRFSERARTLAKKGATGSARLPEESVRALERAAQFMKKAADALDQGDAEEARAQADRAQTELERARSEQPSEGGGGEGGEQREGRPGGDEEGEGVESTREHGVVPQEEKNLGRAFRERVQAGLRDRSGRYGASVSRYLEKLQ